MSSSSANDTAKAAIDPRGLKATSINTLSEFLLQAHTQHMVLDLGRGLRLVDNQSFFEWENQQAPCAFPRQDHAWFCITFWNNKLSCERYIWFIKLPLDENGLMQQAARNQFLDIIIQALGKGLEHSADENAQLPDNPYIFTPSQQQLADCNAHIKQHLKLRIERNPALDSYLQAPSVQEWQHLKLQDIANYICESTPAQQALVAQNLALYPAPLLNCLLASCESIEISNELSAAIIAFYQRANESHLKALCLRAMCYQPSPLIIEFITQLIHSDDALDMESLVVISGRYWALLKDESILLAYANQLAQIGNEHRFFAGVFADLVKVPETRSSMLGLLRNPNRSETLAAAIGSLFSITHSA